MNNNSHLLTPYGTPKKVGIQVARELTEKEIKHLKRYNCTPDEIIEIYETEGYNENWNLMLTTSNFFLSVPKDTSCASISVFGTIEHVEKIYNFKNL